MHGVEGFQRSVTEKMTGLGGKASFIPILLSFFKGRTIPNALARTMKRLDGRCLMA